MGEGQDTSKVRKGHDFDVSKLEAYLIRNIPGFAGPLEVRQFNVGQSNPTFLVIDGKGAKYVVRKKPGGKLLSTAHMIEREYRILQTLHRARFPVPKPYSFCDDPSCIGTPFYVMEFVQGRIFTDVTLEKLSPGDRRACYKSAAETLAALHSLDYKKLGLEDFGKSGQFYQRQITRMSSTSRAQEIPEKVEPLPHLDPLLKWFASNLPQEEVTIVHGDYKMDNIIFHPTEPRVIGVLDWEMSTIGHPLSDLANFSIPYYFPSDFPPPISGLQDLTPGTGVPTEEEFVRMYCAAVGRPYPIAGWNFCVSFSFFRLAVILQGIASRAAKGQASNPAAELIGQFAPRLAEVAWEQSQKPRPKL